MWYEVEQLFRTVQNFNSHEDGKAVAVLLSNLEKYKVRLQNLCKNAAKSSTDRANLSSDVEQEVNGAKLMLSSEICNEARIISDIFNMNEWDALQIVLSGESQMSNFTGLNRGLIAVICYYDTHRLLARILRTVLSWDHEVMAEPLREFIQTNFVNMNVFKHLIQLQATFSVSSEFSLLSQPEVNGLGGTRHQQALRSLIDEVCAYSSESLYSVCSLAADKAQEFAAELYPILKSVPVSERLSSVHLSAWCSLIRLTSSEVLGQATSASTALSDMIREIRDETAWSDQSLCGTVQLACAIAIRAMAVSPADHLNITNVEVDVDRVVDRAVQNFALKFIRLGIIGSTSFKMCSSHFRIVDTLFKQLIAHFPGKLMEIERNSEDELTWMDTMAKKGQQVSTVAHYSTFLGCISDLYYLADDDKVHEDIKQHVVEWSAEFCGLMELCRFVERARIVCHAVHAVSYLEMARSICRSQPTAQFLYDVFARVPANEVNYIGWEQVMTALRLYERTFREQKPLVPYFGAQPSVSSSPALIAPQELAGLISWINLARAIAEQDPESGTSLVDNRGWQVVDASMGVVSAPVPLTLKGAIFRLLAALAEREQSVAKIWSSLHSYQICSFAENGALLGLQQELEERECISKQFDSSLGFAYLMKALLSHGTVPDFALPYLQYLSRSIVGQMALRSYNDVHQMWELAEVSLSALLHILEKTHTDARAVARKDAHVQLLVQILNNGTPLYKALCTVLLEDCDAFQNPSSNHSTRLSQKAALVAIRLLSLSVSREAQLRVAVRSANSDVILTKLEVLLLSPLRNDGTNIMDIAFQYLEQVDDLPVHALSACHILRDLCYVRPSLQKRMVELMRMRNQMRGDNTQARAVRAVLNHASVEHSVDDVIDIDLSTTCPVRCRGETARVLLELLSDSVQSDPAGPNLCYLLFEFEKNYTGQLYKNEGQLTGFHEVISLVEQFDAEDPLSLPFSALLEPAFRLLQRLVAVDCVHSSAVLRHLRSNDVIGRLVSSRAVVALLNRYSVATFEHGSTLFAITRMIVGSILNLAALEISSLLKTGHFDKPSELYRILLDVKEDVVVSVYEEGPPTNLLFSILKNGHTLLHEEVSFRNMDHFNANKLDVLFENCKMSTVFGIAQYDIACLLTLLKREIASTQNEEMAVSVVEREMTGVLEYCTDLNSELMLRGASDSLVSGCTALLNVIALFAPVPFFSIGCQLDVLSDASFALIEFVSGCSGDSLVSVCETLHRLCKSFCSLAKQEHEEVNELRDVISHMFAPLVELLLQPGGRPLQAKVSLYDSARLCLRTAYSPPSLPSSSTPASSLPSAVEWMLEDGPSSVDHRSDPIRSVVDQFAHDISKRIATDVVDLPISLKISPLLMLSDLLNEDANGSKRVSSQFSKTGMPRYLTELLAGLQLDWVVLSRKDAQSMQTYKLFVTIVLVLTRLSLTDPGWTALAELAIPEVLCQLEVFARPPKQVFLEPVTVTQKNSAANLYTDSIDLIINLCLTMCSKPKWKRLSLKVLDVVHSHSELLSQLLRAEVACSVVDNSSRLVRQIWQHDEATQMAIDGDPVLRLLRERSSRPSTTSSAQSASQQGTPGRRPLAEMTSFNTPTRLFGDMMVA